MFNKRWKKILLWTLSVIIVLGVAGLFAANYAVDKLMNSMVGSFDLESEDDIGGGQEVGTVPTDPAIDVNVNPVETPAPTTSNTAVGEGDVTEVSPEKGEDTQDIGATATSKPTDVSTKEPNESSKDGYVAQVTTDKAKEIQESVTIKEKADVASILLGQLSVSDINRLKDLASGGLNLDEKKEARSIILGKVSEEQYNELIQIAKKYGVSQGRTHDQVIGEEEQAKEKGSE